MVGRIDPHIVYTPFKGYNDELADEIIAFAESAYQHSPISREAQIPYKLNKNFLIRLDQALYGVTGRLEDGTLVSCYVAYTGPFTYNNSVTAGQEIVWSIRKDILSKKVFSRLLLEIENINIAIGNHLYTLNLHKTKGVEKTQSRLESFGYYHQDTIMVKLIGR